MTHLSRSDLLRWRDTPDEADRPRIIAHLAACDACAGHYAELMRTRPLEHPAPALPAAAFVALGASRRVSSFNRTPSDSRWAMRWVMAAAAVVVLAVLSWQMLEGQRLRSELQRVEAARATREQETQQQSRANQARAEELTQELQEERSARLVLERELARQREPRTAAGTTARALVSLFLTPGRLRSSGETKTLRLPSEAAEVSLMLDLGERRGYRNYRVAILNADGTTVWSRADVTSGDQLVMVSVPARLLTEDDYEVDVQGVSASGQVERVGDYYFRVLRR